MRNCAEDRLSALTETDPREFAAITAEAGNAEIISPEFHLVTPAKVAAAHAAACKWCLGPPTRQRIGDAHPGQGGRIISDDPAELIAYLKKRGLR